MVFATKDIGKSLVDIAEMTQAGADFFDLGAKRPSRENHSVYLYLSSGMIPTIVIYFNTGQPWMFILMGTVVNRGPQKTACSFGGL